MQYNGGGMSKFFASVKWLPIAVITFAFAVIAVAVIAIWQPFRGDNSSNQVAVSPPVMPQASCTLAEGYPGRSVDLDDIPKTRPKVFPRSPADTLDRNFDPYQHDWYGKHLRALGESSLIDRSVPDTVEIYRFTWLRTFHHPVMVRLEHNGYGALLTARETNGAGGYEPGKVFRTGEFHIESQEWCRFIELLNASKFWSLPSQSDDLGNDGSEWILEGIRGHRYHSVERWTPQDGAYYDACSYLLQLSGRDTKSLGNDFY
jgi:hypothetical protein